MATTTTRRKTKPPSRLARSSSPLPPGSYQTTVSSKYQVVIPKGAREQVGVHPGQKLAVLVKGRSIALVPIPALKDLRGFAPGINLGDIRDEEDRP